MADTLAGLPDMLTAWADGQPGEEPAVALLRAHGRWLEHDGFVSECVFIVEPGASAAVDWMLVPRILSRSSCGPLDTEILRIARQLARWRTAGRSPDYVAPDGLRAPLLDLLVEVIGPDLAHNLLSRD